jgi:hypothetical protein
MWSHARLGSALQGSRGFIVAGPKARYELDVGVVRELSWA